MCFQKHALSLCWALLTHCQKLGKIHQDAGRGTSFLFVCCVAWKTLTVIRTWWLLIVTNNCLKVAEAAGFPDTMLSLNMMGRACKAWISLIYGLELPQRFSCPWIFPSSHLVSQAFKALALWWPKRILGAGLCFSDANFYGPFLSLKGNNYRFKEVNAVPLLSARTAVSSNKCQLPTARGFWILAL